MLDPPRTLGGKVHDFHLAGSVLAETDLITTQPGFVMYESWKCYGLQILEPVAAPNDFPIRFAWSGRLATDPANMWLRQTEIAAYREHEADVTARIHEAAISLGP